MKSALERWPVHAQHYVHEIIVLPSDIEDAVNNVIVVVLQQRMCWVETGINSEHCKRESQKG
jgi:hypothetical protein